MADIQPQQQVGDSNLVNAVNGGVQNLSQLVKAFNTLAASIQATIGAGVETVSGGATGLTFTPSSGNAVLGGLLGLANGGTNGLLDLGHGGTGVTSATAITALLGLFSSSLKGLTPASSGGTTNFLRADGSWAVPPTGAGTWASYTPTLSAGSGTFTNASVTGRFVVDSSGTTFFLVVVTIVTNGTAAGLIKVTLPSTPTNFSVAAGRENAVSGTMLQGIITSGSTTVNIFTDANTYPGGNGAQVIVNGFYT